MFLISKVDCNNFQSRSEELSPCTEVGKCSIIPTSKVEQLRTQVCDLIEFIALSDGLGVFKRSDLSCET